MRASTPCIQTNTSPQFSGIRFFYDSADEILDQYAIILLRDDLDENGGGDLDFEAAAGSGVMIVADLQLCKFFRRRC